MELKNTTHLKAIYTLGLDPAGREYVVVAVKGTFSVVPYQQELVLAEEQLDPVLADEFVREPATSSVRYESDFALTKRRCDVLVNGRAYAPHGRAVRMTRATVSVGPVSKTIEVHGDRVWTTALGQKMPSAAVPFTAFPISYDRAFGGVDVNPHNPADVRCYGPNPVGVGFYPTRSGGDLEGKPLPNTCQPGVVVNSTTGQYVPMSFGAVGRAFDTRRRLAGTYDDQWMENCFPFLPPDFDVGYYQSAPLDQQIAYPVGGEIVVLDNLTPSGRVVFSLPSITVPVEFTSTRLERHEVNAFLDTVVIEPDESRVLLTWRASYPLRKNILELAEVIVGRMTPGFYRARAIGKQYFRGLGELSRARREEDMVDAVEPQGDGGDEAEATAVDDEPENGFDEDDSPAQEGN